ncbi:MAG: gamma-glutamyltransferase, partial [Bacteroidota bacterium]
MRYLILITSLIFIHACRQSTAVSDEPIYEIDQNLTEDSAMVVSPHPLASDVGAAILAQGGNAVDAAIAVQFAIAVVYPRAGNIGGGGFMVIRQADGSTDALDYREKAPAAADRDMYLDSAKNVIPALSTVGHLSTGVPGTVAGMWAAHQKYGQLDWKKLVQPAYELAKNGFQITATEADRLNYYLTAFQEYNTTESVFAAQDTFLKGFNLVQADLAATLSRIRDQGKAGFYEGETAQLLVAEMGRGNGIISLQDLKAYEAKWREPISVPYKNYRLISMPPASSGGIAVAQMLKMIEDYPLSEYGFHSIDAIQLMTEVERRAFAD